MTGLPLLVPEPVLVVLRGLAKAIGVQEAMVLQQIHFYALRSSDGWVQRSVKEWRAVDFPFWGERTIERILERLRERDLVVVDQMSGFDRTLRYRVNYDTLPSRQLDGMESANLAPSDPANLTESVTRNEESSPDGEDIGLLPSAINEVFLHWKSVFSLNGNAKLTTKRRKRVRDRLNEGYSVERLKRAIEGCHGSDWHVERDHTDLELICRDGEHVERFERMPPRGVEAPGKYEGLTSN